jgi:DNA-binding CsgD family transcriptional regulator/tetratricopeptide (TPR) repeat protein
VLLAMAARPRQVPERFSAVLERAHREGTLARIEVAALSREQANELLSGVLSSGAVAPLFEASGGNPLYLEQLARSLAGAETVTPAGPTVSMAGIQVPAAVAAALREELALLSPDARRALEGAAVAGDPFEPELAAAAAAVEEAAAIDALDELLQRDLVRATDVPRRFAFRHPLVRRAVYEGIPGGWRLTAHERCAEALAARGASAATRAHHVEQAGRHGDLAAVAILREAADSLAGRAPAGAARWYEAALRLLPETAPPGERVDLLKAFSRARTATGQFAEARSALLSALDLIPEEPAAERVRLAVACAEVEQLLAEHDVARARLERTLEELDDPDSPEAAALMVHLALDSFYRPGRVGWRELIERAVEIAPRSGDRALTATTLAVAAILHAFATESPEGTRYRTEAAALFDSIADADLEPRVDGLVHLVGAEVYLEAFEEAVVHGTRALALVRATGQDGLVPTLVPALWSGLWMRGRLAEGIDLLDGAIEGARLVGNDQTLAWYLFNRALAAGLTGDLETALTVGGESYEMARSLDGSFVQTWSGLVYGFAHLESGQHTQAAELMMAAGGELLERCPGVWRAYGLEWLTRCWVALGRLEDARKATAAAAEVAASTPLRMGTAWAKRAQATVALARGEPLAAARDALASAAVAEEVGTPLDGGLARALAGKAFAAAGDRDRAAEELERAAATLDACGSVRHRDEAERELRKLGRHTSRTRRGHSEGSGVESLTERELQVARLVVERRTNPEIAAELFLSLKTVETHMRNIFAKLGVSSRVDVARVVESSAHGGEPVAP